MSTSRVKSLCNALATAGWSVTARLPGEDGRSVAAWELRRSTRGPTLEIVFIRPDGAPCLSADVAHGCVLLDEPRLSLTFDGTDAPWRARLAGFIRGLNFERGTFVLRYVLGAHGWAESTVWSNGAKWDMVISYLEPDPLGRLAEGVVTLMTLPSVDHVTASWPDEPGENEWVIERRGTGVEIRIGWHKERRQGAHPAAGKTVFSASCTLMHLAREVASEMERVLAEFGLEGYADRWRHPFPMEALGKLQHAIRQEPPGG